MITFLSYTFCFEHYNFKWKVFRTFKELKEIHKRLSRMAKAAYGIPCSHIPRYDFKRTQLKGKVLKNLNRDKIRSDWPVNFHIELLCFQL